MKEEEKIYICKVILVEAGCLYEQNSIRVEKLKNIKERKNVVTGTIHLGRPQILCLSASFNEIYHLSLQISNFGRPKGMVSVTIEFSLV